MKNLVFVFLMISIISCKSKKKENIKSNKLSNINSIVIDNAILAGEQLIRIDSFPSKYITPRKVDVWLPENYAPEKNMLFCICTMDKICLMQLLHGTSKNG